MKVGDFFVELGVKADTVRVKDFTKALGEIPLSVAGAITTLAGVNIGFMAFTSHVMDMANGLNTFRAATGLSTQILGQWQSAAEHVGVTGDAVAQSITGIADAIVQVTRFGNAGPAAAFGRLGIGDFATKSPFEILQQLRKRYKEMDPNEFRALTGQVGVAPEMSRLFELSPSAFNNAMKSGPTLTSEDLKVAADFQFALADFKNAVEISLVPIFKEITPIMGRLATVLADFIKTVGPTVATGAEVATDVAGGVMHPTTIPGNLKNLWIKGFGNPLDTKMENPFSMADLIKSAPVTNNITVNQHIHGVTDGADADSVGSQHLQREIVKAAKQISRNR